MHWIAYGLSYVIWAVWTLVGGFALPPEPVPALVADTFVKSMVWIGPSLLLYRFQQDDWLILPKSMFFGPFPWLAAFIGMCLTTTFLHTVHILVVGIDVWGVFDPIWIGLSLAAAVIEEIAFRGFQFNRQAAKSGVVKAAVINGFLFALFHFPQFLLGQDIWALLGFRFWMIAGMGFVFSMLFAKWKHLGLNIFIHFLWNLLCFWFALA